jgi:hypothetical protein
MISHENGPPGLDVGPRPGYHPRTEGTDTNHTSNLDIADTRESNATESQQVSFWSVHEHVEPVLDEAGSWPMAGSPAWCALDDTHPAKTAALYDAARHWVLRVETCQAAQCEASHDVSAATDWSAVAREIRSRNESYIKRVAS